MKLVVAGRLKQLNPGTRNTTAATQVLAPLSKSSWVPILQNIPTILDTMP